MGETAADCCCAGRFKLWRKMIRLLGLPERNPSTGRLCRCVRSQECRFTRMYRAMFKLIDNNLLSNMILCSKSYVAKGWELCAGNRFALRGFHFTRGFDVVKTLSRTMSVARHLNDTKIVYLNYNFKFPLSSLLDPFVVNPSVCKSHNVCILH